MPTPKSKLVTKPMGKSESPSTAVIKNSPKAGSKRPLPIDDESEEEEVNSGLDDAKALLSSKKGKPTPKRLMTNGLNANKATSDDSEDVDENKDEDENSEEDESDAEEAGSDEENESDEDEDEDESDEGDEDESASDDENDVHALQQNSTKSKMSAKSSNPSNTESSPKKVAELPEFKGIGKKTGLPQTPASTTASNTSHCYLISNLPTDVNTADLQRFLTNRIPGCTNFTLTRGPYAFINLLETSGAQKLQNMKFGGRTIYALNVSGTEEGLSSLASTTHGTATKTILLTNIPKSVTEAALQGSLPTGCQLQSLRLLTEGPKNKINNAAFLSFASISDSEIAMKHLSTLSFNGQHVRAMYKTDITAEPGTMRTLLITNLPPNTKEAKIRKAFPDATQMNFGPGMTRCFIDFADESSCNAALLAGKNMKFGETQISVRIVKTRVGMPVGSNSFTVTNIPFSASADDVKKHFSNVVKAELTKPGTCILHFSTSEDAQSAKQMCGSKQMDGRTLRAVNADSDKHSILVKNLPFKATKGEVFRLYPGATKVFLNMNAKGQPSGSAFVDFSTPQECKAAVEATKQKQLHGRQLFASEGSGNKATIATGNEKGLQPPNKKSKQEVLVKPKQQAKQAVPKATSSDESEDEEGEGSDEADDSDAQSGSDEEDISNDDEEQSDEEGSEDGEDDDQSMGEDEEQQNVVKHNKQRGSFGRGGPSFRSRGQPFKRGSNRGFGQRGGRGGRGGFHRGGRGNHNNRGNKFRGN